MYNYTYMKYRYLQVFYEKNEVEVYKNEDVTK